MRPRFRAVGFGVDGERRPVSRLRGREGAAAQAGESAVMIDWSLDGRAVSIAPSHFLLMPRGRVPWASSVCACLATIVLIMPAAQAQSVRAVTVDDLMRVRTIVDAKISPSGDRIAYVVSTPSVEKNVQETALFVAPSGGGPAVRVAEDRQIFTPSLPAPRLRWAPDGRSITFLGLGGNRPQVFIVAATGGPTRALTSAAMGVSGYDWAPDGTRLAFISREPSTPGTVVRAGTPDEPTRLWIQTIDGEARAITP